jgi:hypothetical protein
MNRINRFSVLFSVVLATILGIGTVNAQNAACTQKLSQAQAAFDIGDLPGIPDLLLPCINSGVFTREENIRAHKLMTEVYLYQDDLANADLWMIELLKVDPEHKLDPTLDPQEIIIHKEKFRYKPIFRVSGSFGVNNSTYHLITLYTTGQKGDEATYSPAININAFLQIEKEVYSGIDIGIGLGYVQKGFSAEEVIHTPGAVSGGEEITDGSDQNGVTGDIVTFDENHTWAEAPVFLKYTYYGDGDKKLNPYAFAGASFGYLISAKQSGVSRNNSSAITPAALSIPDPNLIDDERRKRLNYYGFAGLGAKFRQKTNFIFVEVRYNYGLMNIVNGDGRLPLAISSDGNKQESIFNIRSVDNDFSLNGILGVLGFQLSIYSPKKLKEDKLK